MVGVFWGLLFAGAGTLWVALVYLVSLGFGKSAGAPGPVWITLLSARDTRELPDEEISTPLARRRRPAA